MYYFLYTSHSGFLRIYTLSKVFNYLCVFLLMVEYVPLICTLRSRGFVVSILALLEKQSFGHLICIVLKHRLYARFQTNKSTPLAVKNAI